MLKKLIITGMVLGLFIVGCVEEPTIAPVKTPFSMLRFGNLVSNVDKIDVVVDGTVAASNLSQNSFTDFIQFTSGKRNFIIKNSDTQEVMFEKSLDAGSYEEQSLYWAGFYSSSIDTSTMGVFTRSEGVVYFSEQPLDGEAQLYVLHGSADTPIDSTRRLDIRVSFTNEGDTVETDSLLSSSVFCETEGGCGQIVEGGKLESIFIEFGDIYGSSLKPNQYNLRFTLTDPEGDETDSTMVELPVTINEGTRNYVYISGPMSDLKAAFEETMPLPVQNK